MPEKKAPDAGKDHDGIVVNRNLTCRCICISCGNGKLSAGSTDPREDQIQKLKRAHRFINEDQCRQDSNAGEDREEEHDKGTVFSFQSQSANGCIGGACTKPTKKSEQSRKGIAEGKAWFDNEQTAQESRDHTECLCRGHLFFQKEIRK